MGMYPIIHPHADSRAKEKPGQKINNYLHQRLARRIKEAVMSEEKGLQRSSFGALNRKSLAAHFARASCL